jgi:glycosyltransferase involved in cell wall biosynthesis
VVSAKLPGAQLHVFGTPPPTDAGATITRHPPPSDCAGVFPAGSIVVVPLRTAIGVRMRILEAWARGLPVVATPEAMAGLDNGANDAAVIARSPEEMASAIASLAADPVRRRALVEAGSALLRARHDPAAIADDLATLYETVASAARARM